MLKLQLVEEPECYTKLTALPVTIGRDPGNSLAVDDPSISDFHAEVTESAGELFVSDLLSQGGTFVNEQRVVAPARLQPWDVIRVGTVRIEIYDPNTPRPDHWALRSESDLLAGQFYTLKQETIVGRDAECQLTIDWYLLSRRHAQLSIVDDHLLVEDLGSRNGTFINDARIEQGVARPGDEIRFDELKFIVVGPYDRSQVSSLDDDRTRMRTQDPDETVLAVGLSRKQEAAVDSVAITAPSTDPTSATTGDNQQVLPPVGTVELDSREDQIVVTGNAADQVSFAEPVDDEQETVLFEPPAGAPERSFPEAALLEQVAGGESINWTLMKGNHSIGRSQENDIVIAGAGISKSHASVQFRSGGWFILDNNSSNGVQVNDHLVQEQLLRNGDVITLGNRNFQFCCAGDDPHSEARTVLFSPDPDEAETQIYQHKDSNTAGLARAKRSTGDNEPQESGHQREWLSGAMLFLILALGAGAIYLWRSGLISLD